MLMVDSQSKWKAVCEANLAKARQDYAALADPEKYIQVDPKAISHHCPFHMRTKRAGGAKLDDWGRVEDGRWDLQRRKVLHTGILADQLAEHFIQGKPWAACAIWAHKRARLEEKGRIDGCRSEKQLLARYHRLDALYEQIRQEGRLQSAEERGAPVTDDLFVSIDREGGFLFGHGGSHRLAMAQLLDLSTIPVRVLMRHAHWQQVREALATGTGGAVRRVKDPKHPDLLDLKTA
ncbi:hypothetical protein J2T60_001881 [Natronospira proteinivora]|uniref:ParB/Sulfiredoxin domain-containing protein n=1 Tax=Natronospira proteinivora TaxID=1807133 RepID=A0ABT1G989_9GAMM|nr:hypothetical protein [Natronospira proteinivora]MCP1727881.1 hypothetical protein [Natronospira proteinivora]